MESNTEHFFIKPGNQERGWNDPPQFSYGLQTKRGPHRNLLNRRAPPPGSGAPPLTLPSSALTPPTTSIAPLLIPVAPPSGPAVASPPGPGLISAQTDSVQSEPEVEEVMSVLEGALEACRCSGSRVQVCNDMGKRLKVLEENWKTDRLSSTVKRQMKSLCSDLKSGLWDSADELHRSLMVDHVTEVSQWMVGVKRLIAETRNLSPDQLRPLTQDSTDQDCSSES